MSGHFVPSGLPGRDGRLFGRFGLLGQGLWLLAVRREGLGSVGMGELEAALQPGGVGLDGHHSRCSFIYLKREKIRISMLINSGEKIWPAWGKRTIIAWMAAEDRDFVRWVSVEMALGDSPMSTPKAVAVMPRPWTAWVVPTPPAMVTAIQMVG